MNNEEFNKAINVDGLEIDYIDFAKAVWQVATASKQREIDELNQQVLELSAQVEVMREALLAQRELDYTQFKDVTTPQLDNVSELQEKALSIPPSSALLAHDNEVAAKALEDAAERFHEIAEENDSVKFHMELLRIAEERRNRK